MAGLLDQLAKNVGDDLKKDFDAQISKINRRFDRIDKKQDVLDKKLDKILKHVVH